VRSAVAFVWGEMELDLHLTLGRKEKDGKTSKRGFFEWDIKRREGRRTGVRSESKEKFCWKKGVVGQKKKFSEKKCMGRPKKALRKVGFLPSGKKFRMVPRGSAGDSRGGGNVLKKTKCEANVCKNIPFLLKDGEKKGKKKGWKEKRRKMGAHAGAVFRKEEKKQK